MPWNKIMKVVEDFYFEETLFWENLAQMMKWGHYIPERPKLNFTVTSYCPAKNAFLVIIQLRNRRKHCDCNSHLVGYWIGDTNLWSTPWKLWLFCPGSKCVWRIHILESASSLWSIRISFIGQTREHKQEVWLFFVSRWTYRLTHIWHSSTAD